MRPNEFATWTVGMALLAAAPGHAQPQRQMMTAVPIEYIAHLATIPVYINGTGPHQFIVDTGAGITVLNEELVAELGIPAMGKKEVGSPMGTEPLRVDSLSIGEMRVGDVVIEGAPAVALNLTELFRGLQAPDGILAAASFDDHLFTIDFPKGHVLIRPGSLPPADGRSVFDFEHEVPRISISVGGETLDAALDTGAPVAVSVPSSFEETLPLKAPPTVTGQRRTVDASLDVRSAELDGDLAIGQFTIATPTVVFNERMSYGLLGMEVLGQFALTIDRSNRRIAFERSDAAATPATGGGPRRQIVRGGGKKIYGIQLAGLDGDVLDVRGVNPGAAAEAGGLRAGDRILAINDKPVSSLGQTERISALRGSPLQLLVDRSGNEVTLTLTLD